DAGVVDEGRFAIEWYHNEDICAHLRPAIEPNSQAEGGIETYGCSWMFRVEEVGAGCTEELLADVGMGPVSLDVPLELLVSELEVEDCAVQVRKVLVAGADGAGAYGSRAPYTNVTGDSRLPECAISAGAAVGAGAWVEKRTGGKARADLVRWSAGV
ncbi:hypothetical protein B484DRAFT_411644, partial [Ochromonadaceae sp. CCMP2298]